MAVALPCAAAFNVPKLTGPVVDDANIISSHDRDYLDSLIRRIFESSKVQMQVLTVKTLDGEPIEQASIATTDKWKLGMKGDDKGVLLFVSVGDKKVRIEVGQGLEGDLPDILASRIIRENIVPEFKHGNMSGGVVAGVQGIASIVAPDLGLKAHKKPQMRSNNAVVIVYILFILFFFILGLFNRRRGFWGGGGGGYWGGGFGGGGGFSGGGGDSWGGGGGGFSGGGASGDW